MVFLCFFPVYVYALFMSSPHLPLLGVPKVWKEKTLGAHLSCKAFNCRVLISWLSSCYAIVVSGTCAPGRLVGEWLSGNHREWPSHEMISPTAVAMILE